MNGHFSEFEDEYLEMMYQFFEKKPALPVRNGDLADALDVSPASATEMVQRLAAKGFVDYIPYKGSTLTDKGMAHGQKMKRRHRLAEVFLASLSFEGNIHATACRLEHAIDDDLEVALSLLLGEPLLDPSGRDIPEASLEISQRINSSQTQLLAFDRLDDGATGTIEALFLDQSEIEQFSKYGLSVGTEITRTPDGCSINGSQSAQILDSLSSKILVRISRSND